MFQLFFACKLNITLYPSYLKVQDSEGCQRIQYKAKVCRNGIPFQKASTKECMG